MQANKLSQACSTLCGQKACPFGNIAPIVNSHPNICKVLICEHQSFSLCPQECYDCLHASPTEPYSLMMWECDTVAWWMSNSHIITFPNICDTNTERTEANNRHSQRQTPTQTQTQRGDGCRRFVCVWPASPECNRLLHKLLVDSHWTTLVNI